MAADDSPATLVARFLRANNYVQTLDAFLNEAGLPADAGSINKDSLTVEQILHEKRLYDLSINFEKISTDDTDKGWTSPSPKDGTVMALPSTANILQASIEVLKPSEKDQPIRCLIASTADRRLSILDPAGAGETLRPSLTIESSPILSYLILDERYVVCSAMSGRLVIYDFWTNDVVSSRNDHSKYAIKVTMHRLQNGDTLLATAGWDAKVFLYYLSSSNRDTPSLPEPVYSAQIPSNPTDLIFVEDHVAQNLHLVVTRRDSTFLHYYPIDGEMAKSVEAQKLLELRLAGRQNLAPHSIAWVAFTPSAMALCPHDPGQLAVATSAVPHMKLIVVRMLFPRTGEASHTAAGEQGAEVSSISPQDQTVHLTQAAQARAELALQDREASAILLHCTTLAPQTAYSTPALAWRPDGSGIWVNSDDGAVRGIETKTGKIIATLMGHEPGSKLRCVWAGYEPSEDSDSALQEVMISGGFDQKLLVWRP